MNTYLFSIDKQNNISVRFICNCETEPIFSFMDDVAFGTVCACNETEAACLVYDYISSDGN